MSVQISQEDKDFINSIVDRINQIIIIVGEVSMKAMGDFLAKMPPADISSLSGIFKTYVYAGAIPAIRESVE